jgi:ABC-type multidrug transport system fused ATPase/permease subunit
MALTTVYMVLAAILTVATPVGFRLMVDAFIQHDQARMVAGVALTAGMFTGGWVLTMFSSSRANELNDRVNVYVCARIASLVQAVGTVEHFERPDYLQELDLLDQRARLLAAAPRQTLAMMQVIVRTAIIVALLASVYWPLALLPLFGIPAFVGDDHSVRLRERADERTVNDRRLATELFALASTAAPAKELRSYALQGEIAQRHRQLTDNVRRATERAATTGALGSALGWGIYGAGFAGAIAILVVRAVHHQATPGDVVMATSLVRRAQMYVSNASDTIGQLATSARTARRMLWLDDFVAAEAAHNGDGRAPDVLVDGITLRDVSFTYPGTERQVLEGVNLHIPAGAVVALVGDNGAGKTTVVKLLTGMYRPSTGKVLVDGRDLAGVDPDEWRRRTTASFQDFVNYSLRAGETVGIGDLPHLDDTAAVFDALERAEAADLAASLPEGLDTPLGWSFPDGRDLSGGQWQKLALARGVMRSAPLLLLLDEPTANLDAPTEHALFERYAGAARAARSATGAITILVSHRFSTVRMADLIVVLTHGHVAEVGNHASLLAAGGSYAELYNLQARSYR